MAGSGSRNSQEGLYPKSPGVIWILRTDGSAVEAAEIRKEYNRENQVISEVFIGPNGRKVREERRQYVSLNRLIWEDAYLNGEPLEGLPGVFAVSKAYNEEGNVVSETCLDPQGQIRANTWGIARTECRYDELCRVSQIRYLDEKGRKAAPEVR